MIQNNTHCIINVQRNKQGKPIYTLHDAPSNTGTFYMNEILADRGRVRLDDGGIITIGATTFIFRAAEEVDLPDSCTQIFGIFIRLNQI